MKVLKTKNIIASFFCASILIIGCGEDAQKAQVEQPTASEAEDVEAEDEQLSSVQSFFYVLPSPFEVASLLKSAGVAYNEEILNDPKLVSNYSTSSSQAINLGIYGADFSLASIFGKTQATLKYVVCIKKLTEELGISNAFDAKTMERFQANQDDQDSIKQIVSDAYLMANTYLKESERVAMSSLILAGGWIEGTYIACMLVDPNSINEELVVMIAEQKYSVENLVPLLEENKGDASIAAILPDVMKLAELFARIEEPEGSGMAPTVENDEAAGMTVIGGDEESLTIDPELLAELTATIKEIRNRYIQ